MARRPAVAKAPRPFAGHLQHAEVPEAVAAATPVALDMASPQPDPQRAQISPSVPPAAAPQPEAWELPVAASLAETLTEDLAPTVTQEVQRVQAQIETPLVVSAIEADAVSDTVITAEVPLFEYADDEPAVEPPASDSVVVPNEQQEIASVAFDYAASSDVETPTYGFGSSEVDAVTELPPQPTDRDTPVAAPEASSAEESFGYAKPSDALATEAVTDDSDLPACLRDDPPMMAVPAPEFVSEQEPEAEWFVAPASDVPADSLIDEVDAAFITAGLPTQETASHAAMNAAETLESIARRLRAGELSLQGGASSASDAATLAAVLAALLADR